MAKVGVANRWRCIGQTSQDKAYAVLKHTLTRSLGIAANARVRMRVLSCVSLGDKSVPVSRAKDEKKHFEEAEREHYRRRGPRARAVWLSLRISNNCI